MTRGKKGSARPEIRRAVGLYAPFVDGPLAEVQAHMAKDLGRTPPIVQVVEYLYRYWKETKGDQA